MRSLHKNTPGRGPAMQPCAYCPYRRDVPSGMWAREEYEALAGFDKPTGEQPMSTFCCHLGTGALCAGWVAVHDMNESLGVRLFARVYDITEEEWAGILRYSTDVDLFDTGTQARDHGLADIEDPGPAAVAAMYEVRRIQNRAKRRGRL